MTAHATRDHILAEATRLFVEEGYVGLSMRQLAERVGVSKAGLYYHFRDKESLFLAILTANLLEIEKIIQQARAAGVTARDKIERIFRDIFARTPEQQAIIRLASQEIDHLSPEARASFRQLYHQKFTFQIQAILQEGIDAGELRPMDARRATWILLGMMYPYFYPSHRKEMGDPMQALDLMLTIFFKGANAETPEG
ncbi:MAG TPA: TetR/AcrR family transcriptional regulator [Anaerolineae bacterium]|nr:TetR/AcrR family transcriptional regulator [Caldilineae bacterium]HID34141.1 TetR/AcrR family transcriptional regulator [Anaerolineae bacterium]